MLAKEQGLKWVGPEVPNNNIKTVWKCKYGHKWEASYKVVSRGNGCVYCTGRARKTPQDYRNLANERGYKWLGSKVKNTQTKTLWECNKGHRWKSIYASIQQGKGCPTCAIEVQANKRRYHASTYKLLAKQRGFKWIGPKVINTQTRTTWECKLGHRWETSYGNIQQGYGCPYCSGKARKTPDDYTKLARDRGFKWLGPIIANVQTKTTWQCKKGHQWKAPYDDVLQGSGCMVCAIEHRNDQKRKKADHYHMLAKKRGFKWLGPDVHDTKRKTFWQCSRDHQWQAHYNSIAQGSGCPTCIDLVNGARVSQIQKKLGRMLRGKINYRSGRYNIDVALIIDGASIAIEYDSWFWHGHREKDDRKRTKKLIAKGWRVLRIKSNALLPSRERVMDAIDLLLNGKSRTEIVLKDWGKGLTKFDK